jgi:hypothetical protein
MVAHAAELAFEHRSGERAAVLLHALKRRSLAWAKSRQHACDGFGAYQRFDQRFGCARRVGGQRPKPGQRCALGGAALGEPAP